MESLQFAIELDVDFFQLSISTPYPGTELFKQALQEGRLRHQDYKYYGQSEPVVLLDDLTPEEIRRFERHALRTFYLRPRQLWRQLGRLRHPRQFTELIAAFNLLIANRLINANPDWTVWDEAREEEMYDLDVTPYPPPVRLTYEIRQRWASAVSEAS